MITGKTIGQLTFLSGVTEDTLFPVQYNNATYHVAYSALTSNVKHWLANKTKVVKSDETVVISGNYVLSGTNLTIESSNFQLIRDGVEFNQYGQIFIGGYLLIIDSNIINDGSISVGGAIILSGNSTIVGTGILT